MGTGALLSSATLKASQSLHSVLRRMSTAKSEAPTAGLIFRASATSADPSCLSLWRAVLSSFRVATSTSLIACTAGLPKVQLSVMSHAGRCVGSWWPREPTNLALWPSLLPPHLPACKLVLGYSSCFLRSNSQPIAHGLSFNPLRIHVGSASNEKFHEDCKDAAQF